MVKRTAAVGGIAIALLAGATAAAVLLAGDSNYVYDPPHVLVNDVTRMNPTYVGRVAVPRSVEEVVALLAGSTGPVSIGGGRYSQGGQISHPGSLHIDMRELDDVRALDAAGKRITVEAGITWREIQEHIDPYDLAVRIMQSYANFTVGGSLSVNVHGRYIGEGPLVRSVESIKIVLADGTLVDATPVVNSELFFGAIGGYGGLGVIVEATLALDDNERIQRRDQVLPVAEYRVHFMREVRDDPAVVLHNADLYPPDFAVARDVSWYRTDAPVTIPDRLIPAGGTYTWQPRLAGFVAGSATGKWVRRYLIDPLYYLPERVAWRNWEASYDVAEIEPADREAHTYALREYFVPVARFDEFVPRMRDIFARHDANVLNVSVRHALPDTGTLLAWAREEVFAFVVYYRQERTAADAESVRAWTRELIDAATALGGSYYLPYQVLETPEQFRAAYPGAEHYFELKARVDPGNRFRNRLWDELYPPNRDALREARDALPYARAEEQTLLTIPEWYLVFNPLEYAEFLESGRNPSDFPFFASIDEYWTLYDRVRAVAAASGYPRNGEYLTMLRVIGISTTFEYVLKGAYETTIGRLTRWLADGKDTAEDRAIRRMQRAYADFIVDEVWYKFDFGAHLDKLWGETPFFGENFVRKLERRVYFTLELGGKALYAKLIGFASRTTFGPKDDRVYFTIREPSLPTPPLPAGLSQAAAVGRVRIVSSPRWGPFTEAAVELAAGGYDFVDVAGNRRIALTVIGDERTPLPASVGNPTFRSRVLSAPGRVRHVLFVDVGTLGDVLRDIAASPLVLEHVYDY